MIWSIVGAFGGLVAAAWLASYVHGLNQMRAMRRARELDPREPDEWPLVTVVVPACNEEDSIRETLASLAAQAYPNLEVLAVDDRSTDATGEIIDRMAADHDRVRAIHIDELPEDWIGKTHALHRGTREARGDWLLFTDGDVRYAEGALRKLVAIALDDELDHLACLPHMETNGFWHEVTYAGFLTSMMFTGMNVHRIQQPETDDFMGIGAFNLVRADFFGATEGFEWLRMEIADDIGLAKLVCRHDGRQDVVMADELLQLEWYGGMWSMVRGLEKNTVAILGHFSSLRVAGLVGVWMVFSLAPFAGLFAPWTSVQVLAGVAVGLNPLYAIGVARWARRPAIPTMFAVIGVWIMMAALVRSTYLYARRDGIEWRGTFYPGEQLRRYQRVRL
jgi:glycosyltransferase involved in cell wall biosynthesis